MKRIAAFLFYVIWMAIFNVITFTTAAVVLIISIFLPRSSGWFLRRLVSYWARVGFYLAFSPVEVRGKENLIKEPSVILCNHQSTLDIPAMAGFFPLDFLFFSKKEVFKIPLVGQLMRKMDYVSVDRHSPRMAAKSLREAIQKVKDNNRLLVFPEGVRNHEPSEILELKPGSLLIAREGKVPILPVVIYGTAKILPMTKKFFMLPHRVVIDIRPAIYKDNPLHPAQSTNIKEEDEILENLRKQMSVSYKSLTDEMAQKS